MAITSAQLALSLDKSTGIQMGVYVTRYEINRFASYYVDECI